MKPRKTPVECADRSVKEFFQTPLAGEQFVPPDAAAALIIVHGINEHRGRYEASIERFLESDIACFTYDQRGHGESPGRRASIGDFSDFAQDLTIIVQGVAAAFPELSLFIWGHSMGSLVLLDYAQDASPAVRGAISTGCPLRTVPPFLVPLSNIGSRFARLLPEVKLAPRISPALLSHDEEVQAAYAADPLVSRFITLRLGFEVSRCVGSIRKGLGDIQIPWLAVHGSSDKIAPASGSRLLVDGLGASDKTLVILDGQRHELHNESAAVRDRFFALLTDWIQTRSKR